MTLLNGFNFPLKDPVPIFVIVLFIILLAPILLRKFRIPSIIGLILAGMAIGDHGFNLVAKGSIDLFGKAGLLYIMFLAGLELDMAEFKKNRYKSLVFGFFTFFIPLSLGFILCYNVLHFNLMASLLVSSMFSTHTLVAYPLASRMGITKNEAVTIAVGGTIITDTAVLLILAVITGAVEGELNQGFWLKLTLSFLLFSFIVLWGFPFVGRLFFKKIKDDQTSHFIFVLAMVFLAALLAEMAGVEGIIGAFLAGLALNQLIPHASTLMNRIEFAGNALFIPFFLISVGMLVDLRVLLRGTEALLIAGVLTAMAISTKWLAAFITQKIFGYTSTQRNVIFGLSTSHAAATIAIILIGYNMKIVNEDVLNGTIILILITCMVGSFITANAGKKIAVIESSRVPDVINIQEKVMIPVDDQEKMEALLDFSIMINEQQQKAPVYLLTVMQDAEGLKEKVLLSNKGMEEVVKKGMETNTYVQPVTRVDLNVANGIARAVKEMLISDVVMEWTDKVHSTTGFLFNSLFGTTTQNILDIVWETVYICRLNYPLNATEKIVLLLSKNAEHEIGFHHWVKRISTLSRQAGAPILIYASTVTQKAFEKELAKNRITVEVNYKLMDGIENYSSVANDFRSNDLVIVISARKGTVSYQSYLETIPSRLVKQLDSNNLILLYPEQTQSGSPEVGMKSEDIVLTPIQDQIDNLNRLGRLVKRTFKRNR
ncbi:MAG: cation:proton antiporter [Agriterribacter sp.]